MVEGVGAACTLPPPLPAPARDEVKRLSGTGTAANLGSVFG